MNLSFLIQLLVNGLVVGTLYGVVAMSFVLIYKATQVVNFAQGELLLIGAWVCWALLTRFQVPFWIGMPLTLVFMFIFGIAIQIVILRPMIGEPIISVIMVTIGLSTVFQAALKWIFGVNPQPFPRVFTSQSVSLFGLQIQTVYVMSLVVSVAMMIGMAWFFRASKYGLAMRATAFDQQVAQSMGISVKQVFAMAWAISAMVSSVAGIVVGVVNGVSSALSGFGIKVFPAVILGGLDSVVGAVVMLFWLPLRQKPGIGTVLSVGAVAEYSVYPMHSSRDIAQALGTRRNQQEPVFMLGYYYYDVPFYAKLRRPIKVFDDWASPEAVKLDSWRKELADAGHFATRRAASVLVDSASLPAAVCGSPVSWVIGPSTAGFCYPFLTQARAVFIHPRRSRR